MTDLCGNKWNDGCTHIEIMSQKEPTQLMQLTHLSALYFINHAQISAPKWKIQLHFAL